MRLIDADALKEHLGSGWVNSEFAICQVDNEITIEAVLRGGETGGGQ